ncbi:SOS response-associated peptidase [Anianabacter salinae]|uniref:SOS response-associated peptidase n=1 Tax=Anianabacter salinae TaxID=2851023 RepID=UPI00225DF1E4|nr:SOS response-associated peptidase [Anianabacter salinae]MBV0912698.1 SOS response-associated peptidase [Anianabacter salinae]
MCGRFVLTLPDDEMARLFGAAPANDLPPVPNFNICPTNRVHAVVSDGAQRRLTAMRWGFLPHWYKTLTDGPLLINARAETIAEKPAFRAACRERRCILPATGFYEWTKDDAGNRLPWYIRPADGAPIAFAAVWQLWERGEERLVTCAIVTTGANDAMSAIHHRMPVTLAPDDYALWLGEDGKGAATLMSSAPEDRFVFHRVDAKVNSNRAHGADLIQPLVA